MNINYAEFGVCPNCETVNIKEANECRDCGQQVKMQSFKEASSSGSGGYLGCIFGILFIVVGCMMGGPIGGVIAFVIYASIAGVIGQASDNKSKAKENKYKKHAVSLLEKQAVEQKSALQTQKALAKQAFDLGNYHEASLHYKNAIEQGDSGKGSLIGLAISYYNSSDYMSAIPLLQELVMDSEKGDSFREVLVRAIISKGNLNNKEADYLLSVKEYFEGVLKKAIILSLAEYFYEFQNELDLRAIEVLALATDFEPQNPKHVELIAELLSFEGRYEEAQKFIENLDETYFTPMIWEKYSRILLEVKNTSKRAVYVFEKYLEYRPEDSECRIRLGQLLVRDRQVEKAITIYEKGLIIDDKNIKLRHQLALTYSLANQINNSIRELQLIMKMPECESYLSKSAIHILLGKCFMKKDMLQMALTQFLLVDRTTEVLELLYDLGEMFNDKGDTINAKKCWEEIFATDVMFKDVSQKVG